MEMRGLEWFSHRVSSRDIFLAAGRSAWKQVTEWAGGRCMASGGLLALQQVETGHVLLQGPDTKTVAVLAVESALLPVGCRHLWLLLPILGGTQAVPL